MSMVPEVDRFERTAQRVAWGGGLPGLERRDPTAATQQTVWVQRDMPMVPEWDADTAVRFGYYANVIAFRCVQVIARTIASLPVRAGLDPDKPAEFNPNAPAARLLGPAPGGPAPKLSSRKLIAWSVAQRLVTGRYAWEIETTGPRGKGDVVALWPLVSARLKALPTEKGVDWFRAFDYGRADRPVRLAADQVFYAWDPSASDFRQPESALQAARYDLSIAVMGDRYSYSFLRNGAVPAALVVTEEWPTKEARNRFRNQWQATHRGVENAGKVAFAEVGREGDAPVGQSIDVKVLGLSQKDARFIEQHRAALEMVAISLGVPWSKLDASGRTFDNAGQEDLSWWEGTILPLLHTMEDEWNMDLAPRLGREVLWFDLSKVRALQHRVDPVTAAVGAPTLVQAQLMTINEARADYGLAPVKDGDRMMTVDEINALRGAADPQAVVRALDALTVEVRKPTPDPIIITQPAPPERRDAVDHEARRARIWRRTDRKVTAYERQLERIMRRLFARQADATLRRLEGKRGRQATRATDAAGIFDPEFWRTQTADDVRGLYEAVAATVAADLDDVFDLGFSIDDPAVQELIMSRANQLAGNVTDTTYRRIQAELAEGTAAGDDVTALAARVRAVFEDAATSRALTIARTEVISAYNGATRTFAAVAPADVVAGQEWISTRDARTREEHATVDGQVVTGSDPFTVGGEQLLYPGDPAGSPENVVNCRCTLALLTPADVESLAGEKARPAGGVRVRLDTATAVLALAAAGQFDEPTIRTRLRERAAA